MSSSSGDDETSVETISPVSTRQDPRQEQAFYPMRIPVTRHASVTSRPAARHEKAYPKTEEWNKYKPLLRRLYLDEKKTLIEVKEHMRAQYNFDASWVYPPTQGDVSSRSG